MCECAKGRAVYLHCCVRSQLLSSLRLGLSARVQICAGTTSKLEIQMFFYTFLCDFLKRKKTILGSKIPTDWINWGDFSQTRDFCNDSRTGVYGQCVLRRNQLIFNGLKTNLRSLTVHRVLVAHCSPSIGRSLFTEYWSLTVHRVLVARCSPSIGRSLFTEYWSLTVHRVLVTHCSPSTGRSLFTEYWSLTVHRVLVAHCSPSTGRLLELFPYISNERKPSWGRKSPQTG